MSAHGLDPAGFTHELGHALFGLADEYWETTEERRTRAEDPVDPDPFLCSCCDPTLGTGCLPGLPECTGFDEFPPGCFPALPVCPPIESTCAVPNVFESRAHCEEAVAEILSFPGLAGSVTASDCHQLCGGALRPCPCAPSEADEVWIVDPRTPPATGAVEDDDLMGIRDAAEPPERFGPACRHCIESAFCIAWELGRGRSRDQVEAHCGAAPP